MPIQDYGVSTTHPFPILIVADGAGSQPHSATGAKTAVITSLDFITAREFKIDSYTKCFELYLNVLVALLEKADELNAEVSALATTLSIVYVLDETVYWMQIGDGIIMVEAAGVLGCVSTPHRGEYANTTVFVTSPNAHRFLQYGFFSASHCDGLIAFTDGLSPILIYQNNLMPAPVCASLIKQLRQKPLIADDLQALLENEFKDASDDDKTLGLLVSLSERRF